MREDELSMADWEEFVADPSVKDGEVWSAFDCNFLVPRAPAERFNAAHRVIEKYRTKLYWKMAAHWADCVRMELRAKAAAKYRRIIMFDDVEMSADGPAGLAILGGHAP